VKYLHFVWSNLTRNRARLTFTLISIVSAFALYGMLAAISVFFEGSNRFSTNDRVFIGAKYGGPLPLSYVPKVAQLPGVAEHRADYGSGIGGYYQDAANRVGPVAVSKEFSSAVDPTGRFVWDPQQFNEYQADKTGALVNENLAREYGWKIGDVIPITVPYLPKLDGTRVWNLTVRGTYRYRDPAESPRQILFHWEYLDDSRAVNRGTVEFIVAILEKGVDPARAAGAVDEMFMNSTYETSSGTQDALRREYFRRIGNVSLIAYLILSAVFLSMLLVTGNSLLQSFAERTREIGTLKALGFESAHVSGLVMLESSLLMIAGGVLGLAIATAVVSTLSQRLGNIELRAGQVAVGVALMLATGVVTGFAPALRACNLSIVEALRKVRR
jgi:putative ABC transport system permease protein